MMMRISSRSTRAGLLFLLLPVVVVWGGKHQMDMILAPTEEFVQYSDGYIRGPGYIDLSGLTFTAVSVSFMQLESGMTTYNNDDDGGGYDDGFMEDIEEDYDEEDYDGEDFDDYDEGGGGGGRRRRQRQRKLQPTGLLGENMDQDLMNEFDNLGGDLGDGDDLGDNNLDDPNMMDGGLFDDLAGGGDGDLVDDPAMGDLDSAMMGDLLGDSVVAPPPGEENTDMPGGDEVLDSLGSVVPLLTDLPSTEDLSAVDGDDVGLGDEVLDSLGSVVPLLTDLPIGEESLGTTTLPLGETGAPLGDTTDTLSPTTPAAGDIGLVDAAATVALTTSPTTTPPVLGNPEEDVTLPPAGPVGADPTEGLQPGENDYDLDDEGTLLRDTYVDIVIFELPENCARTNNCDWSELGVGKRTTDGTNELRWCCSQESADLGLCESETGRLMIDENKFTGTHLYMEVPAEDIMQDQKIRSDYAKVPALDEASYVVLYANCDTLYGREISVQGEAVWKSKHGYLPGELYGFMNFYSIVLVVYIVLACWFGMLMKKYKDTRIAIENWIYFCIILGCLEMFFRRFNYTVWNNSGNSVDVLVYSGIIAGVLKQGFSRCLIVMVSLGWGVVTDTLGGKMCGIVSLGIAYIVTSTMFDVMFIIALESITKLSYDSEKSLFSVIDIVKYLNHAIDVLFIVWAINGFSNTMAHLDSMKQTRKLERMGHVRIIFFISAGFAFFWAIFAQINKHSEGGIVAEQQAWLIDGATEINYLFFLFCIAILWRPNENAREYAYVMELGDEDDEGNGNDMDMVPSAVEDEDRFI